ncbi:SMC family ATPase [Kitasatospora sp. GP82]|uniref:SMC family ATPase n=1 Tax=Kitasatospora sp. GP82 TaxID=3035089 RepID=UPI0024771166|nr:SMC family ATPase [Kitasatospora sp. GP82]MDH6125556.1 exonuclease SbcC [Kitasatospora sp. GP82]
MRLHQLTVTAFGPFAGTEQVDFDHLASGGLFLLRGATGAGKSSVLDAVCFALYGEVPGARKGNPLRSDHAEPLVLTEVRLELTLGGRRLEITRSPEQRRPKRRGTGTTVEKPQTLLREWSADLGDGTPGWRALSRSHQEAGEEIRRLIGMSREQFCQVVLLPQGDFARFLRADANDRAALLRQLFDTGRFDLVERWLGEQRRKHEAAVQDGRLRLRDLASRAQEAAGPDAEPPTDWVPGEDAAGSASAAGGLAAGVLGWAAILRNDAAEQLAVARSALAEAEAAQTTAQRRQQRADELADRQRRHRAAAVEARRLHESAEQLTLDERRLAAAQAALGVESVLRLRDSAAAAQQAALQAERDRRAALARLAIPWPAEHSTPWHGTDRSAAAGDSGYRPGEAELAEAERLLQAQLGRLEAARADERRQAELSREQAQLVAERARAEELAEEAQDWLLDFDGRLKSLQEEQEAARAAGARVEQLDSRCAELGARLTAAVRRDELHARIAGAEAELSGLRGRAQDAREHSLDLRERRLAGMAAELAGQLRQDEPCRVCGSQAHPAPAQPGDASVGAADEASARAVQSRAEQTLSAAESALTMLRVEEAAASGAAGAQGVAALEAALAESEQHRRSALRATEGLERLEQRIARLTDEQSRRQAQLRQAGASSAALAAREQAVAGEQRELEQRVSAARADAPSVAARAAALTSLADAVVAALAAVRGSTEAAARLAEAEAELVRTSLEAGFAAPEAARAALLPAAERLALQARLEQQRTARDAVERVLTDPELVAAAALPAVDPGAVSAELRSATVRLRATSAVESTAVERCAALARIGRELAALATGLTPALERYGRISRLAGLASGTSSENVLRMRLESYVLAARLEQVAQRASDRLVRMSGGRYTLVHSDDRVAGNRRSGLALRVVDAWTGIDRDTATLSGGESFFASLALALGLADVVTDEAGGMPLDTLFIDEGFGSLDEQALEEVMDVLDGLRERDRAVGIVSHVADLRSRIPTQLLVRKGRHGSTLRLTARADG